VAQVGTKLFIIAESYNHVIDFDRRALHSDLELFESSLVASNFDPITITSEVYFLATEHFPPSLILSRTGKPGQHKRKRKRP
jgi:hypothetical protein